MYGSAYRRRAVVVSVLVLVECERMVLLGIEVEADLVEIKRQEVLARGRTVRDIEAMMSYRWTWKLVRLTC
jgi:hypothetical protein